MSEKEKQERNFRLLQQAAESLGVGLSFVCGILESLDKRLEMVEADNVDLKKRVFEAETYIVTLSDRMNAADLKNGILATAKIPESTFGNIQNIESFVPEVSS